MGQLMQKNAPQLPHHTLSHFVEAFDFGCQAGEFFGLSSIVVFETMPIVTDATVKRVWCFTDNVSDDPHAFGAFIDLIVFTCSHDALVGLAKIQQNDQEPFARHPQTQATE